MNPDTNSSHRRAQPKRSIAALLALGIASSTTLLLAPPASATPLTLPVTGRMSVSTAGEQVPKGKKLQQNVYMDGAGRFVFFSTNAALQADDTNGYDDVYVRDRIAGTTTRVSLTDGDTQIVDGYSRVCGASDDGRFVGFVSAGENLPGNLVANGRGEIFLRDRVEGTTVMVSVSSSEVPATSGGGDAGTSTVEDCPVSATGRYVAFATAATNLDAAEPNAFADIFRRDLTNGITQRISVSSGSAKADAVSRWPSMSDDGSVVSFQSAATNLVAGDTNGKVDVFVRSPGGGVTIRASLTDTDVQSIGADVYDHTISGNGKFVAFTSTASDLTLDDETDTADVFVRDLTSNTTELVSKATNGSQAIGNNQSPSMSDDGRFVTFNSTAKNLYVGDSNNQFDSYRRDRTDPRTDLISRTSGILAGGGVVNSSPISDDGDVAAFLSTSTTLVRNDTNEAMDAFTRELKVPVTPFESVDSFVKQQFADFIGRQPTAAELAEWKARVVNGELSPDHAIDSLAHGGAWAGKRAPLTRLYWAFFLRTPDLGGMNYWTNQLTNGKALATVAKQFSTSSEFQNTYGSKTNSQFVTLIYQNIFDRDPDPSGLTYWTNKLDTKQKTRGEVMVNFSESSEGKRVLAPQTDVVLIWLGMMRTMPNSTVFALGVGNLEAGNPPEVFAEAVRNQSEYAARVTV